MSIEKHIDVLGNPDAVVFSFDKDSLYGIWGFDDTFSLKSDAILPDSLNDVQTKLNQWKKESNEIAAIGFFSYDSKNIFFPKLNFKPVDPDLPAVWFAKPKVIKKIKRESIKSDKKSIIKKSKSIDDIEIYQKKINQIKNHLRNGDVYQINYTQPSEYMLKTNCDFELFLDLFQSAKPDFGAYLNMNETQIISLSPENFFTKIDSDISSFPIKGTRAASSNEERNKIIINELKNSDKERAEHVMIVDLIRNDLGKICEYGSVATNNLFNVVSYETIHHMVTEINGKIKSNVNEIDVFKALFPGGSITGAPKQRAVEIIDEIESYSRGIYTGSMGIIRNNGDMIFNIAIRTLTLKNGSGIYPVGGGIVWDSNANDERQEALDKSKVMDQ